jgi:hypothetical protein
MPASNAKLSSIQMFAETYIRRNFADAILNTLSELSMSEPVCKLVFNGEIAPGANTDEVRSRVAAC